MQSTLSSSTCKFPWWNENAKFMERSNYEGTLLSVAQSPARQYSRESNNEKIWGTLCVTRAPLASFVMVGIEKKINRSLSFLLLSGFPYWAQKSVQFEWKSEGKNTCGNFSAMSWWAIKKLKSRFLLLISSRYFATRETNEEENI